MDKALGVDGGEGLEHRDHDVAGVLHTDLAAVVGDVSLEGDALNVVHDEIGRVVFVEVAGNTGNVGVADKLGQCPGLLLEPLGTVGESLRLALCQDGDGGSVHPGG